jgi:hypothetical protein
MTLAGNMGGGGVKVVGGLDHLVKQLPSKKPIVRESPYHITRNCPSIYSICVDAQL